MDNLNNIKGIVVALVTQVSFTYFLAAFLATLVLVWLLATARAIQAEEAGLAKTSTFWVSGILIGFTILAVGCHAASVWAFDGWVFWAMLLAVRLVIVKLVELALGAYANILFVYQVLIFKQSKSSDPLVQWLRTIMLVSR